MPMPMPMPTRVLCSRVASTEPIRQVQALALKIVFRASLLTTALLATESLAAKRTFAKKKGKTQMWITIIVVVGTVLLALLCALYCQCGERIYTSGNGRRNFNNNEQEPLIVEGKPIPPP